MVRCKEKSQIKKQILKKLRNELKHGRYVSLFGDMNGRQVLYWVFHKGLSAKAKNKIVNDMANLIVKHSSGYVNIVATDEYPDFGRVPCYFTPHYVWLALRDQEQFKRGRGGKSLSATHKWCNEHYASLTFEQVRNCMKLLHSYSLVVRTITGTFWPKEWFKEVMDEQGIGYLPTVKF